MENQNPLEMQNQALNPDNPPHLSIRPNCNFCGAVLTINARQCQSCGAEIDPGVVSDLKELHTKSTQQSPAQNPLTKSRSDAIKSRLEPDHSQPINKQKLIYSIIIMVLALVVIGLLQHNGM